MFPRLRWRCATDAPPSPPPYTQPFAQRGWAPSQCDDRSAPALHSRGAGSGIVRAQSSDERAAQAAAAPAASDPSACPCAAGLGVQPAPMAAARARLLPAAAAAAAATAAAAGGLALAQPELPALGMPYLGLAAVDPPASPAAARAVPAHGGGARRGLPPMAQVGWVRDLAAGEGARLVFDAESMCRTPVLRDHMVPPSAALDGSVLWPLPAPAALSRPCAARRCRALWQRPASVVLPPLRERPSHHLRYPPCTHAPARPVVAEAGLPACIDPRMTRPLRPAGLACARAPGAQCAARARAVHVPAAARHARRRGLLLQRARPAPDLRRPAGQARPPRPRARARRAARRASACRASSSASSRAEPAAAGPGLGWLGAPHAGRSWPRAVVASACGRARRRAARSGALPRGRHAERRAARCSGTCGWPRILHAA